MKYRNKWLVKREKSKKIKTKEIEALLNVYSESDDMLKLKNLTDLFLECHDLLTRVGEEISVIVDSNSKGC